MLRKEYARTFSAAQSGQMLFIDGGLGMLVDTPSLQIAILRVCGIVYGEKKKIVKREFMITKSAQASVTDMHGNQLQDVSMTLVACGDIDSFRRCMEWQLAIDLATEHNPKMIVLDGTLQTMNATEEKLGTQLVLVPCIAVSKTTDLKEGIQPVHLALEGLLGRKEWWYVPLAQNAVTTIGMARFNERSDHCFRIDLFNTQQESWGALLAGLKSNSNDAVFPGYPYGLILVDQLARISEQEKEMLLAKLQVQQQWKDIRPLLTASNAHAVLDSLQF